MKLTAEQIAQARQWQAGGRNYAWMTEQLGCTADTIRRVLDPEWAEKRNAGIRANRAVRRGDKSASGRELRPIIPVTVLFDRERRLSAKVTPNMTILGDPLPGRSALDRMGGVHG